MIPCAYRQTQAQLMPIPKVPGFSNKTPRRYPHSHPVSASVPSTPAGHLGTFQMHPYPFHAVHQPIVGKFGGSVGSPTPSDSPRIPQRLASMGVQAGGIHGPLLPSGFVPLQPVNTTEVRKFLVTAHNVHHMHANCKISEITGSRLHSSRLHSSHILLAMHN
jgi:hypothetical protein